jgi:hypothetical protein
LVRFGLKNVGDIDFEVIFTAENSIINSRKPGFGKKNQLRECGST